MKFENKIVGFDVDVAVRVTTVLEETKTFHFKGSQRAAERKAWARTATFARRTRNNRS